MCTGMWPLEVCIGALDGGVGLLETGMGPRRSVLGSWSAAQTTLMGPFEEDVGPYGSKIGSLKVHVMWY